MLGDGARHKGSSSKSHGKGSNEKDDDDGVSFVTKAAKSQQNQPPPGPSSMSDTTSSENSSMNIVSGRYCKEKRRQDCIILDFDSIEQTISVVYSDGRGSRPILTEGDFVGNNNALTAFKVHWVFKKTTKFVRATTGKIDTDRLLEAVPPKVNEEEDDNSRPVQVWRRNPLNVEVAVITDVKDPTKVDKVKQMLADSFPDSGEHHPHAYLWSGVRAQACPTHDMGVYNDEHHDISKIVGTTTAHFRIWVEFYRRHRHNNPNARIIIFEDDALCSEKDCGDRAIRQIQVSKADIFYLGWCYYHGDKYLKNYPPLCLHAYSLTVRGAYTLMNNVYPCLKPGDNQVADLGYHKKLSWAIANITGSPLVATPGSTKGLWKQPSPEKAPTGKPLKSFENEKKGEKVNDDGKEANSEREDVVEEEIEKKEEEVDAEEEKDQAKSTKSTKKR